MFKKIIITFFILILGLFSQVSFADSIPVENIFSDITKDYKYLNELQTLYDKGMITPDSDGKFNPNALLNRDEFVGILMEVTCKDCIQPETTLDLIQKYEEKPVFYDINKENKYFYCVADAANKGYVSGYHPGTVCEDGTVKEGEKPFCSANTIILEEAIAIVLRASGILTNEEAEQIRLDIYNGIITESISDDVSPKNLDGSVYSFYPDLRKALEYEVVDVDLNGNVKYYTLIDTVDGKIRPKKAISKEEFLRIAYVTLKANSCEEKKDNDIALKMLIFDETCSKEDNNCNVSDLNNENDIYDFSEEIYTTCEAGISEPEGYIWRFYNYDTGKEIKKYGKYLDNYEFLSNGKWKIFLRVIDKCGSTSEVNNTIYINNYSTLDYVIDLKVSIDADPIYGEGPLLVDFEGIVSGGIGPYTYYWDYGDGNDGFGKDTQNIFKEEGVYEVTLYITDKNGRTATATVLIQVILNTDDDGINDTDNDGINDTDNDGINDTDSDGINDYDDLCPLLKGDIRNKGCPILEKECGSDNDCREGYYCTENTYVCLPKVLNTSCEYTGGDIIFGNVSCNTCPCNTFLDFTSTLRKCDIIFPAITSPDSSQIYSKGELFQIK